MNSGKGKLVLLCTLLLAVACVKKSSEPKVTEQDLVATLKDTVSDVRTRKAKDLKWKAAAEKAPLHNHDAVMTGELSKSTLLFRDQSTLSMGERTMIVVLDREEKPTYVRSVIALPTGTIDPLRIL